jgi:uncharacterized protein YukE
MTDTTLAERPSMPVCGPSVTPIGCAAPVAETLPDAVRRIAETLRPEKVILFGSYGRSFLMPTGPVILDPKDLRLFAGQLKQFNHDLAASSARLEAQFRRLGETWRDPAYAKFASEFEQTMRNLQRFRAVSDEVVPRLLKTAERAEAVHP